MTLPSRLCLELRAESDSQKEFLAIAFHTEKAEQLFQNYFVIRCVSGRKILFLTEYHNVMISSHGLMEAILCCFQKKLNDLSISGAVAEGGSNVLCSVM